MTPSLQPVGITSHVVLQELRAWHTMAGDTVAGDTVARGAGTMLCWSVG